MRAAPAHDRSTGLPTGGRCDDPRVAVTQATAAPLTRTRACEPVGSLVTTT